MRVKSAAPGGRSAISTNKMIAACYQDNGGAANQRTLDSSKDYDSGDGKKGRSSRLFN